MKHAASRDISTFCYAGDRKVGSDSRLTLPLQVLSAFKARNDRNLKSGEFRQEIKQGWIEVNYGGKELLLINVAYPGLFSIDNLVYMSHGFWDREKPVFSSNDATRVFLYSFTDGARWVYQAHPLIHGPREPGLPGRITKHDCFQLVHVTKSNRIQLGPIEAALAEGPERYTRIEGYQPLSCFTLRKSYFDGRRPVIEQSSSLPAQLDQHLPGS